MFDKINKKFLKYAKNFKLILGNKSSEVKLFSSNFRRKFKSFKTSKEFQNI